MKPALLIVSVVFILLSLVSCLPDKGSGQSGNPPKITAFLDTIIQDWEGQDYFAEEYFRKTGIRLEIIQPPHQQYMDSLFLYISSNRVPDVCEILPEYLPRLVNSKIAVQLDDFIEESMYLGSLDPEVLESVRYGDGHIYGFPARDGGGCVTYVRKDWLDAAGLEVPETWDEYLLMLEAFTYGDPDGNGIDDTYGLTDMFSASQDWYNRPVFQDARAEIYFDGTVWRDGFSDESVRGALSRLLDLYNRSLIDPSFISNTTYSARTKFFNGEVGSITYWANHWARNLYERTRATVGKKAEVVSIPAIEGARYIRRISPLLVITSGAEYPGFVFTNFIDRQYDKGEIQTLFTYGVEGYHWSKQSGTPRFLPNPEDPYHAPFTKAFVPPTAVLNDWQQPMSLDSLVVPAVMHLNQNPDYDRLRNGGEAYDRYFNEIERNLKPDIITAIVTGQLSIDEGLARYRLESAELKIDRILDELNHGNQITRR
ncbi:extracellular solute-binding protein [Marispirochaeta sp.]|jgi:putative aldouronate transport system substrate-binding protein|uniref:extracellular solute-binding protein n=1 Tax=Marispirochaeta sp. TaxID=2038653 RepID=UPI0029C73681|nr:extracellular solute-binding protein [Marispirochaeta sp.]